MSDWFERRTAAGTLVRLLPDALDLYAPSVSRSVDFAFTIEFSSRMTRFIVRMEPERAEAASHTEVPPREHAIREVLRWVDHDSDPPLTGVVERWLRRK